MNPREAGFLLLTSHLGNPERKPLTTAQLRTLADRMRQTEKPAQDRELEEKDLIRLGFRREMAERILGLLREEELLRAYCARGEKLGCRPVTRVSDGYPVLARQRLGLDSTGCLWTKGDVSLLGKAAVSLVGSRELLPENRAFAEAVGRMAAGRGLVLISGNARGADRAAQESCLAAGGRVISIVADELCRQKERQNVLYLSEDGFEEPFSSQRALSRNRLIHAMGQVTFVAQCGYGKGGTWDGSVKNLHFGWSPLICFRDGGKASRELEQMGAYLMRTDEIQDFSGVFREQQNFLQENTDVYD